VVALALVATVLIVGIAVVVNAGRNIGTTSSSASTTTNPAPTFVAAEIACPTPGLGWQLSARMTILPEVPRARVTANVNGIPAFLGELSAGLESEPLNGLQPSQRVDLTVEHLDRAGQLIGNHSLQATTPPQPC